MEGPPPPNALIFEDEDLLVFVDETGHEKVSNPDSVFGVGGIIAYGATYNEAVVRPWNDLREKMGLSSTTPLHAATDRNVYLQFLSDLAVFFESGQFVRHVAMVTPKTKSNVEPFVAAAASGLMQNMGRALAKAVGVVSIKRVVYVVERSQRLHSSYATLVGPVGPSLINYTNGSRRSFPHLWASVPKSSCIPGLEVADFVLHAAQGHVRRKLKDEHCAMGKDFRAVFRSVPDHFVEYMEISEAHGAANYGPPGITRFLLPRPDEA